MAGSAQAAGVEDWYVVKSGDTAYAFDANAVEAVEDSSAKSLALYVDAPKGATEILFFIDCRTDRGAFVGTIEADESMTMTEGSAEPFGLGWSAVPRTGSMRVAAKVACLRRVPGSAHADSQKAALDTLKNLSN
jgi:hypothetical protein